MNSIGHKEHEDGDHILTYRAASLYTHHGVYVGGNKVVHFSSSISSGVLSQKRCPFFSECGLRKANNNVVQSCLDCFLKGGSIHRFEYGVSKLVYEMRRRRGLCSTAASDGMAVDRAMFLLRSETGFGSYNLFEKNCEGFAFYCKTGLVLAKLTESKYLTAGLIVGISEQVGFTTENYNKHVFRLIKVPVVCMSTILESNDNKMDRRRFEQNYLLAKLN